jgi:hypothetical protein
MMYSSFVGNNPFMNSFYDYTCLLSGRSASRFIFARVLPGVQTIFFKGRGLSRADTYETTTCMATGESK